MNLFFFGHVDPDDSIESVDIFQTAMQNCFVTGKVLLDKILAGEF